MLRNRCIAVSPFNMKPEITLNRIEDSYWISATILHNLFVETKFLCLLLNKNK